MKPDRIAPEERYRRNGPLLVAVADAFKEIDNPGYSDLYDEQPITLTIHTTLGQIRSARAAASYLRES